MSKFSDRIWPGIVIVEGIMGSGKTTTVLGITDRLKTSGISALGITEGVNPHPIRFDWNMPWEEMPPAQLADASVARWQDYADHALISGCTHIVDGQIFHGNLTSLFLLNADMDLMQGYVSDVISAIKPLRPFLIYFHQDNIDQAIRTIATERGDAWVQCQINWKLGSPYAVGRGLAGLNGLIELYRDYRRLTDHLYLRLDIKKVRIENSGQEWSKYEEIIDHLLANPDGLNAWLSAPIRETLENIEAAPGRFLGDRDQRNKEDGPD
jgi:hypothetical protein